MAEEKQDLRVKKTQRMLATTMLTMLESRAFSKITVNDLCEEAMVSRTAFYSHFDDKYDLLRFCLNLLKSQLFMEYEGDGLEGRLKNVLAGIYKHSRVFKNLIMAQLDTELIEMISNSFKAELEQRLQESGVADKLGCPPDIAAVFYASAITASIIYWLENNQPYSLDEMAAYLFALTPAVV